MNGTGDPMGASARERVGFAHLLAAEWTKARSLRSTWWTLSAFVVATIGITALLSALIVADWARAKAGGEPAQILADPLSFILGPGVYLGQLAPAVLGVVLVTREYSTGVIRASLLAVPKRTPVLAAKAVVLTALVIVPAEVAAFGSFLAGSALLAPKVTVTLSEPGVARAVTGAGLYLAALALFALGVGAIVRHTAAGIATVVAVVLVAPALDGLLPGSIGAHIVASLPQQAGSAIYTVGKHGSAIFHAHSASVLTWSPWAGFGVFCAWTAAILVAAAVLLRRRDA